jgi:hypothetical protein
MKNPHLKKLEVEIVTSNGTKFIEITKHAYLSPLELHNYIDQSKLMLNVVFDSGNRYNIKNLVSYKVLNE